MRESTEPRSLVGRRAASRATVVIALLLTAGALQVAQPILVPIAPAILLAFVLGPVVGAVERRLGRLTAVALVIVSLWVVVGVVAWTATHQIASFAQELPHYRAQLRQRVAELRRAPSGRGVSELQATMDELLAEMRPGTESPPPVVVQGAPSSLIPFSGLATMFGSAGLITLLLVFMLIERQELRNRLIRLAGYGRLALTTKALDDASRRISRYLPSQAVLNLSFGVCAGIGLFALGVPYYLCKGLRLHSPLLKIVAASFGGRGASEPQRESLLAAGADIVATSLFEARDLLIPWVQLAQSTSGRADLDAGPARVA